MNQGIHTVDLLLWLLGDIRRVQAQAATALHSIEAEDTAAALMQTAGGALVVLQSTTSVFPGYPRRLEITGSEGTIILDHDQIVAAQLRRGTVDLAAEEAPDANASASSPTVCDVRGHRRVLQDFLHAIQSGTRPCCDGYEGRRSVAVVQAIYRSARDGVPVFAPF